MTNTRHETKMAELAELTGLTFDGGDDTRLFTENNSARTLHLDKKQYEEMEKLIHSINIEGQGFSVYAWNDTGGYEYWTESQEEDNYIQITVDVESYNINLKELREAIEQAENALLSYRDWNHYEPHRFPDNHSKLRA